MKKYIIIALCSLMILPSIAFAKEGNITKEFTFKQTSGTEYNYEAKKELEEKGEKYKLKGIKYEVIKKGGDDKKEIKKNNNNFEDEFKENDVQYKLKEVKENVVTHNYTQTGVKINTLPKTKSFIINNNQYKGTLVNTKSKTYSVPFSVQATFTNINKAKEVIILGQRYSTNTVKPAFVGYDKILKEYLELDNTYTFTGSNWMSSTGDNKTATYTGTRVVNDYTGTYTATEYTGIYENSEDEVKAICEYEYENDSNLLKIIIITSVAIILLAILIAAILFFVRRKRKENE